MLMAGVVVLGGGCGYTGGSAATSAAGGPCTLGRMPDTRCSPGTALPGVTAQQVCVRGYSSSVRDVPLAEKDQVFAEYGVTSHRPGEYEVDHLLPLELGGSNEVANLWPEAAEPRPGFHEKDEVENYLHDQVCIGKVSLAQAQHQIATNWLGVYQVMVAQR